MTSATSGRSRQGLARATELMVAGLLAALVPGCGGGGSVTGPPPPPATVTNVVGQGSLSGVPPGGGAFFSFTTTRMGTLDIKVQWTSPGNDLDLILVRAPCSPDQLFAEACSIVGVSESPTAKPERLEVDNALSTAYVLFVLHLGVTEETVSYEARLTSVGAASREQSVIRLP